MTSPMLSAHVAYLARWKLPERGAARRTGPTVSSKAGVYDRRGTQNLLCAYPATAVFAGLAMT